MQIKIFQVAIYKQGIFLENGVVGEGGMEHGTKIKGRRLEINVKVCMYRLRSMRRNPRFF